MPEYHPAVSDLELDQLGRVWLRGFDDRQGEVRWTVLSEDGDVLMTVTSSRSLRALTPIEGGAWAVTEDDLGVPYLVQLRLEATGADRDDGY